jgi:hypothetical protein
MNRRDYTIYMLGYHDAARGAGLSDSPYGGTDGFLWRRGVATWLDEHGDQAPDPASCSFGSPAEKTTRYDGPGRAISTRPLCLYGRKTGSEWKSGKVETWRPAQARP